MFYLVETKKEAFVYYSADENPEKEILKSIGEKAGIIGISPWEAEQLIGKDKIPFRVW